MMRLNLLFFAIWVMPLYVLAIDLSGDFFSINSVSVHTRARSKDDIIFVVKTASSLPSPKQFLANVKVSATTQEQVYSLNLFARAYFYNKEGKLIATMNAPTPVERDDGGGVSAMPVFFPKGKKEEVYFAIPEGVLRLPSWSVLVVFGDQNGAVAAVYPKNALKISDLQFSEKKQVENPQKVERSKAINPLIEHTIRTGIPRYPEITLFLRKPIGAADFSETKGVLALCVLAKSVAAIKRQLQEAEAKSELGALMNFAEKHKLAIICWGSRSLWNPKANWDEISKQEYMLMDDTFDDVAKAWSRGVTSLSKKYGIPTKDFLLVGHSGSGQYAARLALRLPEFFLAVHVHVPSSFDKPTKEASSVLWCLTTGEEEGGYDRSLKFLEECKKYNYPIIYKAIPKLGHAGHPTATRLGLAFFEYAMAWRGERDKLPVKANSTGYRGDRGAVCPDSFLNPPYRGDIFRQKVYPASMPAEDIPPAILIPLPNEDIARAWESE